MKKSLSLLILFFGFFAQGTGQHRSETVFVIKEKDFIPEGLAYHHQARKFYIGSLYKQKIATLGPGGIRPFILPGQNGLMAVLGIKVDKSGQSIFAAAARAPFIHMAHGNDSSWSSAIFKFNAASGQFQHSYRATDSSLFNDIVIDDNDDVYITDTWRGSIGKIDAQKNELIDFLPAGTFNFPNGIACFRQTLYIATTSGISLVNLSDKKVDTLATPAGCFVGGIDGLYYFNNSLIGVQNAVRPKQIIRIYLDQSGRAVSHIDTLARVDADQSQFSPTTGAVADNYFYYIVNAQVRSFDEKGRIFPSSRLAPIFINRIKLED